MERRAEGRGAAAQGLLVDTFSVCGSSGLTNLHRKVQGAHSR